MRESVDVSSFVLKEKKTNLMFVGNFCQQTKLLINEAKRNFVFFAFAVQKKNVLRQDTSSSNKKSKWTNEKQNKLLWMPIIFGSSNEVPYFTRE